MRIIRNDVRVESTETFPADGDFRHIALKVRACWIVRKEQGTLMTRAHSIVTRDGEVARVYDLFPAIKAANVERIEIEALGLSTGDIDVWRTGAGIGATTGNGEIGFRFGNDKDFLSITSIA